MAAKKPKLKLGKNGLPLKDHKGRAIFDHPKINLNKAGNIVEQTPNMYAIYRHMALDLIRGGKVVLGGCQGYELQINAGVTMLPSQAEKILRYKLNSAGELEPIIVVNYKQKDDFTPSSDVLKIRDGVDPVVLNRFKSAHTRRI